MSTSNLVLKAVTGATKKWTKQRKAEERRASARTTRRAAMTRSYSIKEIAYHVMGDAYMKASAGGTLPAHARQVMYAARPLIAKYTEKPVNDQYFIQTLLADYMNENPEAADWNVVFDARGHFHEPHTKKIVPLGTLDVRDYLADVDEPSVEPSHIESAEVKTVGPAGRYSAILFIEKEGFMPLFQAIKLAERYDIAIMSTKGMSVTAARELVDTLMRDTRRYIFKNHINVIDVGLRLADIKEWALEYEPVYYRMDDWAFESNLSDNGADDDEIKILRNRRVELNAFASDDLISWIEKKLDEHSIEKVMPDDDLLFQAYKEARIADFVEQQSDEIYEQAKTRFDGLTIDENFTKRVRAALDGDRKSSWDDVVFDIAQQDYKD